MVHLLVVDYYTIHIKNVLNSIIRAVIQVLQQISSENGTVILINDNGPQYSSEFQLYTRNWEIKSFTIQCQLAL